MSPAQNILKNNDSIGNEQQKSVLTRQESKFEATPKNDAGNNGLVCAADQTGALFISFVLKKRYCISMARLGLEDKGAQQ